MTKPTLLLSLLLLTACGDKPLDQDGDGHDETVDCDDLDASVHPDADEYCNLVDDDCNGTVDDEPLDLVTRFADTDGDGWGDAEAASQVCPYPATPGLVDNDADCDDSDAQVHPGAMDLCTDPRDLDCDGDSLYTDADGDGWAECEDCDDSVGTTFPGADETCNEVDDDCDGYIDEDATNATEWFMDLDGDGYGSLTWSEWACEQPAGYVAQSNDCDDTEASVYPGATEVCDDLDNDCDGFVDNNAVNTSTWYADADGDHFGDADTSTQDCDQPEGYVADATDCDDDDISVHPGSVEICDDGADNDCDGLTDDPTAIDALDWYADSDGDGWGDSSTSLTQCTQPSGYELLDGDCDDSDDTSHPYASELCDETDHDCDGDLTDGAVDMLDYYADGDGDGWGDGSSAAYCDGDEPSGWVDESGDCDDADEDVHPWATEWCNEVDDDCDGTEDNGAVDADAWYADTDGDGYGDPDNAELFCEETSGYVDNDEDCDDTDADVNPDAEEVADNGVDDDCDGYGYWLEDMTVSDTNADAKITGSTTNQKVGHWVQTIADLDADGDSELLVNRYHSSTSYIITGDPAGTSSASSAAGATVSGILQNLDVGDVDGDGTADLLWGHYSSGVSLEYGPMSTSHSTTTADVRITGGAIGYWVGLADMNGDGDLDILATDRQAEEAYVFFGNPTSSSISSSSADVTIEGVGTDDLGWRAATLDSSADGIEDLALSVYTGGSVFIVVGDSSLASSVDLSTDAEATLSLGSSNRTTVRAASDLNGDGYDDLIVGAYSSSGGNPGTAYIYEGPISGSLTSADAWASFEGASNGDHTGVTADVGDLDGDGDQDMVVGATQTSSGGSAYVLYSVSSGDFDLSSDSDAILSSESSGDSFGWLTVGDLDGDLVDDLAIGAIYEDEGATDAGAVYLFYGTDL